MLLLLDHDLWAVINNWVEQLDESTFVQVLPLLRRTFSNYSNAERRKLGEKVKSGGKGIVTKTSGAFDEERGMQGVPVVLQLLGYQ
jgi:hypothetical protein